MKYQQSEFSVMNTLLLLGLLEQAEALNIPSDVLFSSEDWDRLNNKIGDVNSEGISAEEMSRNTGILIRVIQEIGARVINDVELSQELGTNEGGTVH